VTREERRAYIRSVVDAAPALQPEDADLLRHLIPLGARRTAPRGTALQEQRRSRRQPAA
jgi:hypothetical protein